MVNEHPPPVPDVGLALGARVGFGVVGFGVGARVGAQVEPIHVPPFAVHAPVLSERQLPNKEQAHGTHWLSATQMRPNARQLDWVKVLKTFPFLQQQSAVGGGVGTGKAGKEMLHVSARHCAALMCL